MIRRLIGAISVILSLPLAAQMPLRIHGDTDLAVVADWTGGRCTDLGTRVDCRLTVQVRRVLKGGSAPGAKLAVHWTAVAEQNRTPEENTRIDDPTVLLFLKAGKPGEYEAISFASAPVGGHFAPASPLPLAAPFNYPETAAADQKMVSELAWAMTQIAARSPFAAPGQPSGDSADRIRGAGRVNPQESRTGVMDNVIHSYATEMFFFDARAVQPVAQALLESRDPRLRMVGFSNRLRSKDVDVLIQLEKELPQLDLRLWGFANSPIGEMDFTSRPDGLAALLRIVQSPNPPFGLDSTAMWIFQRNRTTGALPWLRTRLDHEFDVTREQARAAICAILPGHDDTIHLDSGFNQACTQVRTASSRIGHHTGASYEPIETVEGKPEDLRAWIGQHESEWKALTGAEPPAVVRAASRSPESTPERTVFASPFAAVAGAVQEQPIWTRLSQKAAWTCASTTVMADPQERDPNWVHQCWERVGIKGLSPDDEWKLYRLLRQSVDEEEQIAARHQEAMGQARLKGQPSTPDTYGRIAAEWRQRMEAMTAQAQATLSPAGWETLVRALPPVSATSVRWFHRQ